jgi:ABC-type glycerol-3-phosphate transport system substrate-binding protein
MRPRLWGLLAAGMILLAACGGDGEVSSISPSTTVASTSTTTQATTTTTTLAPTTTSDLCAEAIADNIETLGVVFDRIDADPQAIATAGADLGDVFTELGTRVARDCGAARGGEAFSEMLVYLAHEATHRSGNTAAFIGGMLDSFCGDPPAELTVQGQAACAGY